MFKWFTNAVEEFKGQSFAINVNKVIHVHERVQNIEKKRKKTTVKTTILYCGVNETWEVEESIEYVVARLNERD
jgi:hypothetical protein